MISNIQPMNDIRQAGKKKEKERSSDPIQAEYDDGKEFLQKNELSQAAIAFHNALRGFEEKNNQDGIANASNQLGNVCLEKGEFEKALQYYQRTWEICDRFDDPMSLLALSKQLVAVYRGLGDHKMALQSCLDMLETYHLNNNPQGTVETMESMVEIYLDQGEKKKAADAFRTIASIHANYNHKNIAESFLNKAKELEAS
ncbi:MAG: tetratricopeptide repeat protein [Proteobacteria bacterium]|nr:tetratricopeptide repeat protein [Pseudomonadota bacterium]MBU1234967.1 tetratricopeptide repeat protein [Pseudomonadota bacterium]MBU1417588.1 tetratricopeptide repeat protein [Pseudomonadota bacterium]MBU1454739.1 tetratricopeptide repeat protein [Pseudomonadota bacterium]